MNERYWEENFSREALAQRFTTARALYRQDLRQFWAMEFPLMAATTLIVMPALTWLVLWCLGTHDPDWWISGLFAAAVALVPPVAVMHPRAPTEGSVAYGMLLNQIAAASIPSAAEALASSGNVGKSP